MGSVEIIVGHDWTDDVRYLHGLRDVRPSGTSLDLVEIRDIIDIVVDGRNITSNVAEESIFGVIGSLIDALVALGRGRSRKGLVEFHCEPWELVVRPDGDDFRISLYGVGRQREVIAHEIPIEQETFLEAVASAGRSMLDELYRISEHFEADSYAQDFEEKLDQLADCEAGSFGADVGDLSPPRPRRASTSSATGLTLRYGLEGEYRPLRTYCGEHSFDMHALLVPGRVEAEVDGRSVPLGTDYPVLSVLALLDRARELLGELESGEPGPFTCDSPLYHAQFDVRVDDQDWHVTFGPAGSSEESLEMTLPRSECLDAVLTLAEMLVEDLRELNERLELNRRLENLDRDIRELRTWYEELSGANVYFEQPEAYLDANAHVGPAPALPADPPGFPWPLGETERLFPQRQWEFGADRLFLSGIQTSPRGLYVPTSETLHVLDWGSGEEIWTASGENEAGAVSSFCLTPEYVLASQRGGTIAGLDAESGSLEFQTRLQGQRDRLLIDAAEFPDLDLIAAAEQRGRVVGISPADGEARWLFDPGHGRFAGCVFSGPMIGALTHEGFFYGLNPDDGEVLWKVRLGGMAQLEPVAHQGRLYAFIQNSSSREMTVHCVQPYTGRTAWHTDVDGHLIGRPGFADNWLLLPVEHRGRVLLAGVDVEAPEPKVEWTVGLDSSGRAPSPPLGTRIDGQPHGIVQSDRFQITCFSIESGDVRWRASADERMWQNGGQTPLILLGNCMLDVRDSLEIRDVDSGDVVHSLRQPFHAPEYLAATGELSIVVGEANTPADIQDRLLGIDLNNFLAEVQ